MKRIIPGTFLAAAMCLSACGSSDSVPSRYIGADAVFLSQLQKAGEKVTDESQDQRYILLGKTICQALNQNGSASDLVSRANEKQQMSDLVAAATAQGSYCHEFADR